MKKSLAILLALVLMLASAAALADGTFNFGGVLESMDLLDVHKSTTNEVLNPAILICEPLLPCARTAPSIRSCSLSCRPSPRTASSTPASSVTTCTSTTARS